MVLSEIEVRFTLDNISPGCNLPSSRAVIKYERGSVGVASVKILKPMSISPVVITVGNIFNTIGFCCSVQSVQPKVQQTRRMETFRAPFDSCRMLPDCAIGL
jgi:type III secretory pathway component EscU